MFAINDIWREQVKPSEVISSIVLISEYLVSCASG